MTSRPAPTKGLTTAQRVALQHMLVSLYPPVHTAALRATIARVDTQRPYFVRKARAYPHE